MPEKDIEGQNMHQTENELHDKIEQINWFEPLKLLLITVWIRRKSLETSNYFYIYFIVNGNLKSKHKQQKGYTG